MNKKNKVKTLILPCSVKLEKEKVFEKAGFEVIRQGKHITMTNGDRVITTPRANPVNAYTMAGIFSGVDPE